MRLLLDTHAYLWWLTDNPRLSGAARTAIADSGSLVHVSAASIWEIALKAALGRLNPGVSDIVEEIVANAFIELPVTARHTERSTRLPPHHRDPFDRLLIAQAQIEDLTLVSLDRAVAAYDVTILG